MNRGVWIAVFLALLVSACHREQEAVPILLPGRAPFLQGNLAAVDARIRQMSLEEKLGQFIILSGKGEPDRELYQWVKTGKIGGLQWQGLPVARFIRLRDSLEDVAPQPLFIAAPGGVLMNNAFSDALPLPGWYALQAAPSDSLRHTLANTLIEQAVALKINYLPSPFLNLWEQRTNQLQLPLNEYAQAINRLNELHILSMAEAFSAIPLIRGDTSAAQDSMLDAFRHLVAAGLSGFRIDGALYNSPTVTSRQINRFFRDELQFGGLLVAEMQDPSQLDKIFDSGVDLIIVPSRPGFVLDYLKAAFRKGAYREEELNSRLRRILLAREWAAAPLREAPFGGAENRSMRVLPASIGIPGEPADSMNFAYPDDFGLASYFEDNRWRYWQRRLFEQSLVLAANPGGLLPLKELEGRPFQILHLGTDNGRFFDEAFGNYAAYESRSALLELRLDGVGPGKTQLVVLHGIPLDSTMADTLRSVARRSALILVNLGRPDNLALLDTNLVVVQAFSEEESAQALAAQLIFGGIPAQGKLPFTLNPSFQRGQGVETQQIRLCYGIPEQRGVAPEKLVNIDAIVGTAIGQHVFPGCQVLIAKGGTIIYNKAFGTHTYEAPEPVRHTDLYDVASVTKVAATTLVAMRLFEEGKFGINDKLRNHLDLNRRSRLRNLTLRKIMTHQSGLQPHLPVIPYLLYRDMHNADCSRYFCASPNDTFSVQVAKDFYFDHRYLGLIRSEMEALTPHSTRFRYSDVNFALMQELLEKEGGAPLDSLALREFYQPLGLQHTLFNPLSRIPLENIIPTQNDSRWRHQLVHGYVHDETAALFGGVAGHAGLFSTAENLAVIFQMLINGGSYGGQQYLLPETIKQFTSAKYGNHRGLGFDKPSKETIKNGNFPEQVSDATFGHTGFTGTCVWADPEKELIYIFLSNRINPDINNRKIFEKRIRERIHHVIYDALDTYEPEMPVLAGRY